MAVYFHGYCRLKLAKTSMFLLIVVNLVFCFSMDIKVYNNGISDNSSRIYETYFAMLDGLTISKVHCFGESSEQFDAIASVAKDVVKTFSDVTRSIKILYINCTAPVSKPDVGNTLKTILDPKSRSLGEIFGRFRLVSLYAFGTIVVTWGADVSYNYCKNEPIGVVRGLYLFIYVQNYVSENYIRRMLENCWKNLGILNIIAHAPNSSQRDYIYVYDPFYHRLV